MRIQSGERAIKYEEKIRLGKGKIIQKEYLKSIKNCVRSKYLLHIFVSYSRVITVRDGTHYIVPYQKLDATD